MNFYSWNLNQSGGPEAHIAVRHPVYDGMDGDDAVSPSCNLIYPVPSYQSLTVSPPRISCAPTKKQPHPSSEAAHL